MGKRRHYAKEDQDFARILNEPETANFRPRFHFLYSEREAEQDAYFWFLRGQRFMLEQTKTDVERVLDA